MHSIIRSQEMLKSVTKELVVVSKCRYLLFCDCRVVAGRTDGYLDFIEIYHTPVLTSSPTEGGSRAPQYKGHRRIRSLGKRVSWREMDIHCNVLQSIKAHQTSIGLLAVASMYT